MECLYYSLLVDIDLGRKYVTNLLQQGNVSLLIREGVSHEVSKIAGNKEAAVVDARLRFYWGHYDGVLGVLEKSLGTL